MIPQQAIDNLFDRFFSVEESRSQESGGPGLGLAIARASLLYLVGTSCQNQMNIGPLLSCSCH